MSDLVPFRRNTCIVNSISHQMGHLLFKLTNWDTGYQQQALRCEISTTLTTYRRLELPAPGRFVPVIKDKFVELEEKQPSQNTHAETAWGVTSSEANITICAYLFASEHGDLNVGLCVSLGWPCEFLPMSQSSKTMPYSVPLPLQLMKVHIARDPQCSHEAQKFVLCKCPAWCVKTANTQT